MLNKPTTKLTWFGCGIPGYMMIFKTAVAATLASLLVTSTFAAEEHTIDSIDDNGVVTLDNGDRYQTDDSSVQSWSNGDMVIEG